jgi:hypothetical protein
MENMCVAFEESGWSPPEKPEIAGLRVEFQEIELQLRVKHGWRQMEFLETGLGN